jgi:hypothetical protein
MSEAYRGLMATMSTISSIRCTHFCTSPSLEALQKYFPRSVLPSSTHLKCIEARQYNRIRRPIAITTGLCKYGHPQAIVQYPVDISTGAIQSGMLRLTCPNLVKAIDEYEGVGAVKTFNDEVATREDISKNFDRVNRDWKDIRDQYTTKEEKQFVISKLGDDGDNFLSSGIIGVPLDR